MSSINLEPELKSISAQTPAERGISTERFGRWSLAVQRF
jgi:hypothetical protein